MQRRAFLKKLGIGTAVAAAACTCHVGFKPLIGTAEEWCNIHGTPMVECVPALKNYADYTNFTQFAICEQIDKVVMETAEELGRAFGQQLSMLYSQEGLAAAGW